MHSQPEAQGVVKCKRTSMSEGAPTLRAEKPDCSHVSSPVAQVSVNLLWVIMNGLTTQTYHAGTLKIECSNMQVNQ